jgi:hypothetical protein
MLFPILNEEAFTDSMYFLKMMQYLNFYTIEFQVYYKNTFKNIKFLAIKTTKRSHKNSHFSFQAEKIKMNGQVNHIKFSLFLRKKIFYV